MNDPPELLPPNVNTPAKATEATADKPSHPTEPQGLTGPVTTPAQPQPVPRAHPLIRFSLRGKADELEARAADTKPLLGPFIMDGQATMIYAAPNTGKTLIVLHLLLAAIEPAPHASQLEAPAAGW